MWDMSTIKINAITVPAGSGDELARRFAARNREIEGVDGFEGFELLQPTDERTTWLVVTQWRDEQAYQAWARGDAFTRAHGQGGQSPVGISAELWSYEVVQFDA